MSQKLNVLILVSLLLISVQLTAAHDATAVKGMVSSCISLNDIIKHLLGLLSSLKDEIAGLLNFFTNLLNSLVSNVKIDIKTVVLGLKSKLTSFDKCGGFLSSALKLVANILTALGHIISVGNGLILVPLLAKIIKTLLDALHSLKNCVNGLPALQDILKKLVDLVNALLKILASKLTLSEYDIKQLIGHVKSILTYLNHGLDTCKHSSITLQSINDIIAGGVADMNKCKCY